MNDEKQSRCGIWQGGGSLLVEGILFSNSGVGNGSNYYESVSIGDEVHTLFLEPMGWPIPDKTGTKS